MAELLDHFSALLIGASAAARRLLNVPQRHYVKVLEEVIAEFARLSGQHRRFTVQIILGEMRRYECRHE